MKDRQAPTPLPSTKIPIVSPVLHCLSLPVIVFWRRNLGYSFLSPKSIFVSTIIGALMLSYIVWNDPFFRARYWAVSVFGLLASGLYVIQLARAFAKQCGGSAEHDQDSGSSRISALFPKLKKSESFLQGAAEPLITVILGLLLQSNPLGKLLIFIGVAFTLKELLRHWLTIRGGKRMQDSLSDADAMAAVTRPVPKSVKASARGRTDEETYTRNHQTDDAEESRFAEVLRLLPPYSLEKAESNFTELVNLIEHGSPRDENDIHRLNQAISYFRVRRS